MTTATQRSQFLHLLFIRSADFSIPKIFQCADLNRAFPHTGLLRAAAAAEGESLCSATHRAGLELVSCSLGRFFHSACWVPGAQHCVA